jgi:hypothetical protein
MRTALSYLFANRKAALLTFEIFWIAVFLLEAASKGGGGDVAQFVYVNF